MTSNKRAFFNFFQGLAINVDFLNIIYYKLNLLQFKCGFLKNYLPRTTTKPGFFLNIFSRTITKSGFFRNIFFSELQDFLKFFFRGVPLEVAFLEIFFQNYQ